MPHDSRPQDHATPTPTDLCSKRVVVTGASGFIGVNLLHHLHAAGAEVITVVTCDRDSPRIHNLPFPTQRITVTDVAGFADAIRSSEPQFVIHLSAYISIERSMRSLELSLRENLLTTISLLTACTEVKAERVILMGSCEEYGQKYCPFDASLAPDPNSPYGASKAAATAYAHMFWSSFKLPTVTLRPSVVYGPGQSPRQLISMVLQALAENRSIAVTEGRQTRDFVYIDDVSEAIVTALTTPDIVGSAWNIGSGQVVTVRQCLELIENITGRTGLIQYGGRPYLESERFHYEPLLESTLAMLPWRPRVMLEEGLRKTWESVLQTTSQPHSRSRGDS